MRHLILSCIIMLGTAPAFSQPSFEGLIRYKAKPAEEVVQNGDLAGPDSIQAFFAPNRIRTEAFKEGRLQNITLALLDQGKMIYMNPANRTFTTKSLTKPVGMPPANHDKIAGFSVRPLTGENSGVMNPGMRYTAWISDSLFFSMPEKYAVQEDLLLIQQDHIALKLLLIWQMQTMSLKSSGQPEIKNVNNAISITATQVLPGTVPQELLSVPADYTFVTENGPERKFKLDEVKIQENDPEMPPPPPPPPAPPVKRNGG